MVAVQKDIFKTQVDQLLSMPNIDTAKAIRGKLIGDLGGDLIGTLQGIRMITSVDKELTEKDMNTIRLGYLAVYEVCDHVVEEYGNFLPQKCVEHLQNVLARHRPNFTQLQQDAEFDPERITHASLGFFDDVQYIYKKPEDFGIEEDAIDYSLTLLAPGSV
jgi:hypothetical protein